MRTPLEQADFIVAGFFGYPVDGEHQDAVDNGVEQVDRSAERELVAVAETFLVNIGRNDLRLGNVQAVLHQEGLLEADGNDMAAA